MAYSLMMTSFDNSAVVGLHGKSVTKRAAYGGETLGEIHRMRRFWIKFHGLARRRCERGGLRGFRIRGARRARARVRGGPSSAATETDAAGTPPKCARLRWWVPEARARAPPRIRARSHGAPGPLARDRIRIPVVAVSPHTSLPPQIPNRPAAERRHPAGAATESARNRRAAILARMGPRPALVGASFFFPAGRELFRAAVFFRGVL